jgi:hypothetical protein
MEPSPYAELAARVLNDIERETVAILRSIGWPTDPAAIEARLTSPAAPVVTPEARRHRQRARLAMSTLVMAGQVRRHLGRSTDPPDVAGAIYDALHTGAIATNLGLAIARSTSAKAIARLPRRKKDKSSLLKRYRDELAKDPTARVRTIAGRLVTRERDYKSIAGREVAINRTAKQIRRALQPALKKTSR